MKNIAFKLSGLFFILLMWGCQKDTENISRITYFPTFDYKGASVVLQPLGTAYADPGVSASEDGVDLPVTVAVVGESTGYKGTTVPTTIADKYVITYSATNSDGFPGTQERAVYVAKNGDLVNSIEGLYTSTVVRNGSSGAQYTNMKYVIISKKSANQYVLSCGIGLYYAIGRNYGGGYLSPVTITANNIGTNDFSFPNFTVGTFGGVVKMESFSVDAANKKIVFVSSWDSGYKFAVTLNQVQF